MALKPPIVKVLRPSARLRVPQKKAGTRKRVVRLPHDIIEFGKMYGIDTRRVASHYFPHRTPTLKELRAKIAGVLAKQNPEGLHQFYLKYKKEKQWNSLTGAVSVVLKAHGIPL